MNELEERLKTCGNLVNICLLILRMNEVQLLPTALEFLFLEVQDIVENHCEVK